MSNKFEKSCSVGQAIVNDPDLAFLYGGDVECRMFKEGLEVHSASKSSEASVPFLASKEKRTYEIWRNVPMGECNSHCPLRSVSTPENGQ